MVKVSKKNKKMLILLIDTLLIIIGIGLILDGSYSIFLQPDDPTIFHIGRIIRIAFGITVLIIGAISYRYNMKKKW